MDNRQSLVGGGRHKVDFCDVISVTNLFRAWKEFRKGKRSKEDVAFFKLNLEDNLYSIHERLVSGEWSPDPYIAFSVRDPKFRTIHKASVRDRVLYQALYRGVYQVFDSSFIYDSYSSRNLKGTHAGVKRYEEFFRKETRNFTRQAFALQCDIRKFFDSIDHTVLIELVSRKVQDQRLRNLLIQIIYSFETVCGKGLPLGNVTSQIFANIYLNELDQYVKHVLKAKYYIRYCDDFVILDISRERLEGYIFSIRNFLENALLLSLHPRKISIRKVFHGIDFLGYVALKGRLVLRTSTKKRMMKKIAIAKENLLKNQEDLYSERVIQSYLGILSHGKSEKIKNQIERFFGTKLM